MLRLTDYSSTGQTLVSNKRERPARWWLTACSRPRACSCQQQAQRASQMLTCCSKPRACSCQQQAGRSSQVMTYMLFKTQSMLLSETSRKGQSNTDLHPIQNTEHGIVSNKQEGPARNWLTSCSKHKAYSFQLQGRASQMLTYILFKPQSMCLSATGRKGHPNADLHPVQNPEHALVSNKQAGPARCWLTTCSKPRACSCQQQVGRANQMLTYKLLKTQSTLLSATRRKGHSDADLLPVQNPQYALVSNKHEQPARCWLTGCQNPEHVLVSNKQEGPFRCWLTVCSKPEHALVRNKQEGPARCWLTTCSKPRACLY